jgi:peroxiredoxin
MRHLIALILLSSSSVLRSEDSNGVAIPRNLLKLIHTSEVQSELGLDSEDGNLHLRRVLQDLDGPWWRSRNLPESQQQKVVLGLETKLLSELKKTLPENKIKRLQEIEVQSLGTRALARADIVTALGLTPSQSKELGQVFGDTDRTAKLFSDSKGKDASLEQKLVAAKEVENGKIKELLTNPQRAALGKLIGKPFDTLKVKRILPLAPEFVESSEWNGTPTTLAALRGQVVVVHFYAFQCHNCVANFHHYNRWHESLSQRGVTVIGIQTPETSAERDASKVRQAAKEKGFKFPVLIDLQNKNWDAWGNTMWPTVYVIDQQGYLRTWWQGELNWEGATGDKSIEAVIDELLAENDKKSSKLSQSGR